MKMESPIAMFSLLLACFAANAAEPITVSVLREQGIKPVSKDELLTLLPGAKVKHVTVGGSARFWTNEPSGEFVASTDNHASLKKSSSARGKWRISESGEWCVELDWKTSSEKWCRLLFRLNGVYYIVATSSLNKPDVTIGFVTLND